MTDIPIIFSGPMVRALVEGRKTQTRRLAPRWKKVRPGDRLWVRENFAIANCGNRVSLAHDAWPGGWPLSRLRYAATEADEADWWNKRPSIHMPRWASRLTLIVTGVKIEPLRKISEADAMAEGVEPILVPPDGGSTPHVEGFEAIWLALHGAASWDENPEVVAVSFAVEKRNIDMQEAA